MSQILVEEPRRVSKQRNVLPQGVPTTLSVIQPGKSASQGSTVGGNPTLLSLEEAFQSSIVNGSERMVDVIERLRCEVQGSAVMVVDGNELLGVVSRDLLARELARPFYRELSERRPVREFLRISPQSKLELPIETEISSAIEAALARPVAERYEPLVVTDDQGSRSLLDVPVLLTAQCRILNSTLHALQAQRAATLSAERERQLLHEQLVVASRQAGRAEVATGVLHNVGNVLNSINISAAVIGRTLNDSKLPNLSKTIAMVKENGENLATFLTGDERGKRLPGYLEKLGDTLCAEHQCVSSELKSLADGLEHIKQVVQMQQRYAGDADVTVLSRPGDLFEDALKVNLVSFERHKVVVARYYCDMPYAWVDKHRVLQILINLVSNAKNAVKASDKPQKRIAVATEFDEVDRHVRFVVTDNGVGISSENLTRIFAHGFTTRKEGHGFGLHSSANAAREMGGSLLACSEGLGQGASFILDLPVRTEGCK